MGKGNVRLRIQLLAALVQNADFRGFFTGKINRGALKSVCVPGLNCYSCPGALGACPIGSLQAFLDHGRNSLISIRQQNIYTITAYPYEIFITDNVTETTIQPSIVKI